MERLVRHVINIKGYTPRSHTLMTIGSSCANTEGANKEAAATAVDRGRKFFMMKVVVLVFARFVDCEVFVDAIECVLS